MLEEYIFLKLNFFSFLKGRNRLSSNAHWELDNTAAHPGSIISIARGALSETEPTTQSPSSGGSHMKETYKHQVAHRQLLEIIIHSKYISFVYISCDCI